MSQAPKNAGSSSRRQAPDSTTRELGRLLELQTNAADLSLRVFRDEERQIRGEFPEPERRRLELDSLQRIQKELSGVLFDCRNVVDLGGWLESPGRRWLFDRYCSAAIAEWDESVANDQPPRVFRTGPETLPRHLSHCSFCRMARRLAEGRVRMRRAGVGRLLRGDEIVDDLVTCALADAFFRARAPRVLPFALTSGSDGEPASITILDDESERRNGQVQTVALLHDGKPDVRVEVNVIWEPTALVPPAQASSTDDAGEAKPTRDGQGMPPERSAMPGNSSSAGGSSESLWLDRLAFPNDKHPDSLVAVGADGSCLIPLVVPSSAAERGVVFKYCGRLVPREGARRLVSFRPSYPTPKAVRTRGSTAGLETSGAAAGDRFEPVQHGEAAIPSRSSTEAIPVSVDAASFRWSD
jgi:hypothetical protein